jgi:hypothetical protein
MENSFGWPNTDNISSHIFQKKKKKLIIFMIVLLPVPGRNALNIKQIHARPCGSIGKAPLAKEVLSTRASGIRRSL